MAYINLTSGGIKNGRAVTGDNLLSTGGDYVYSAATNNSDSVTVFNNRENYYAGSLNYGTGVLIDTAGRVLYDANQNGRGLLENLLIVNRGQSTAYFGINVSGMHVASGTALASGESFNFEDPIRSVWALTSTGTATLSVQGNYRRE